MLNFPMPYPEELLYSTVARAGVHFGITSPKRLLDEAFGCRTVVATADLPSHLNALSRHYPKSLGMTPERLAYKHTLFPLYAPFIPETRRQGGLQWMTKPSKGAVHLSLGVATSRVKSRKHFRLCPECLNEQLERYGECFWERFWQVAGCKYCLKHALLSGTQQKLRNYHRHEFIALSPKRSDHIPHNIPPPADKRIELRVCELLNLPPSPSPSLEQWGLFYKHLAHDIGITRGNKVNYDLLKQKLIACWPEPDLQRVGILIDDSQSSWLRLIVRKHRKGFSYLEHIVALEALLGPGWHFPEVLNMVLRKKPNRPATNISTTTTVSAEKLAQKRKAWLATLKTHGTRLARLLGGDAIYTWLYRHDRKWLLKTNARYRRSTRSESKRVDWRARDWEILERLLDVRRNQADRLDAPRKTRRWFCDQADCRSYEKQMAKLPLSSRFLKQHSEDVATYQIRRVTLAVQNHGSGLGELSYPQLLRAAGLNDKRLKDQTRQFLQSIGYGNCL